MLTIFENTNKIYQSQNGQIYLDNEIILEPNVKVCNIKEEKVDYKCEILYLSFCFTPELSKSSFLINPKNDKKYEISDKSNITILISFYDDLSHICTINCVAKSRFHSQRFTIQEIRFLNMEEIIPPPKQDPYADREEEMRIVYKVNKIYNMDLKEALTYFKDIYQSKFNNFVDTNTELFEYFDISDDNVISAVEELIYKKLSQKHKNIYNFIKKELNN